jgi:hypothetical protein
VLKRLGNTPFGNPKRISDWLIKGAGECVEDVKQEMRCCFCWRGPVEGKGAHAADKCGWLASWNKKRAGNDTRLSPIVILEGGLMIPTTTIPLTVERLGAEVTKVRKELKGDISALDKRVSTLEGSKKKRKGASNNASTGGASAPTASTSSQPSAQPARTGTGTGGQTGRAQRTSNAGRQPGRGRGRGSGRRGTSGRGGA